MHGEREKRKTNDRSDRATQHSLVNRRGINVEESVVEDLVDPRVRQALRLARTHVHGGKVSGVSDEIVAVKVPRFLRHRPFHRFEVLPLPRHDITLRHEATCCRKEAVFSRLSRNRATGNDWNEGRKLAKLLSRRQLKPSAPPEKGKGSLKGSTSFDQLRLINFVNTR